MLRTSENHQLTTFSELRTCEVHRHLTLAAWAGRQRTLLSRPTLRRSMPIAAMALPFVVRVGPEGAVSVRMVAQQRGLQGYGSSMSETNVYGAPAPSTS